jgi:hypothetical protein
MFLLLAVSASTGVAQGQSGLYGEGASGQDTGVYGKHVSTGNYGYLGSSDAGVFGLHKNTGNFGSLGNDLDGVYGETISTEGTGAYGYNKGSGNYGYLGGNIVGTYGYHKGSDNYGYLGGDHNGVYGESKTVKGSGVYGFHTTEENYGYIGGDVVGVFGFHKKTSNSGSLGGDLDGVFGESRVTDGTGTYGLHQTSGNYGYLGSSDAGVYGKHKNTNNYGYLGGSENGVYGESATGNAGFFNGNVHITGSLSKGSGTFIQPHAEDPTKEIHYAFFEGPEHAVFLRGTAKLTDGAATIELPRHFQVVAAEKGVRVQVTPHSADTFGLAVDYFVTAVRAGFEDHEPVMENTHFAPGFDESASDFMSRFEKDDLTTRAIRAMLISNGILTEEGKLNMAKVKELGWNFTDTGSSVARAKD